MINFPGVVFTKIAQKFQPALQNDVRSCIRPEGLPTDGADTFDSADEDVRRRRQEQQQTAATISGGSASPAALSKSAGSQPSPVVRGEAAPTGWRSYGNLLSGPGSRALFGNLARNTLDRTSELVGEEAPHLFDEEYHHEKDKQKEDKRRANRLAATNPPVYY